jgi:hypothetical protein
MICLNSAAAGWETFNEIDVFESHPETYSSIIAMKLEEIGLLMLRD